MQNVMTINQTAMPTVFRNMPQQNDALRGGMPESFATLSIKSSRFTLRHRGVDNVLRTPDGNFVSALDVVLIRSAEYLSKIYYPSVYQEGDDAQPTCFSIDSTVPDPASAVKQSPTCAACPHNVWGSKTTPQGNATKACADSRRLAIVPVHDIMNEGFGGPVLLRVPPASLKNLAQYGAELDRAGVHYFAVATRLSFDPNAAYPLLTFSPARMLTDMEAGQVVQVMQNPVIERMLSAAQQPTAASPQSQPHAPVVPPQARAPAPPAPMPPPVMAPQPMPMVQPQQPVQAQQPIWQPQPQPQYEVVASTDPAATPPVPVLNPATGQWELPQQAAPPAPPPMPIPVLNPTTGQWELPSQQPSAVPSGPVATAAEPVARRRRGRTAQGTQATTVTDAGPGPEPEAVQPTPDSGAPVAPNNVVQLQGNGAAPLGTVTDFMKPAPAGLANKVKDILGS